MSLTTPNLGLKKPELTDTADITSTNENWDIVDEQLGSEIPNTYAKKTDLDRLSIPKKLSDLVDDSKEKKIQFAMVASEATCDGNGVVISENYAKIADLTKESNSLMTAINKKADKSDIPTKITDLEDDTVEPTVGIRYANDAGRAFGLYGSLDKLTKSFFVNASTEDLTAGTSSLETGVIYFVYE